VGRRFMYDIVRCDRNCRQTSRPPISFNYSVSHIHL